MNNNIKFVEGCNYKFGITVNGIDDVTNLEVWFRNHLSSTFKVFKVSENNIFVVGNTYECLFSSNDTIGKFGRGCWQIALYSDSLGVVKSPIYNYEIAQSVATTTGNVAGTTLHHVFEWNFSEVSPTLSEYVTNFIYVNQEAAIAAAQAALEFRNTTQGLANQVTQDKAAMIALAQSATDSKNAASASAAISTAKEAGSIAAATQSASSAASAAAIVTGQSTGQSDVLPTINWQFAKSKVLPRAITFVRNSIATYFDAQGILRTARNNEPCFDHDPVTGESLGLASWEARTNLVWGWVINGGTVTTTGQLAPDGSSNAIRAQNTPSQNSAIGSNPAGTLANGIYTKSVYAKADGPNAVIFFEGVGTTTTNSGGAVWFNLNTLAFGGDTAAAVSWGFQTLKNGWYRVWIVAEKSDTKIVNQWNTIYVGGYGSTTQQHSVILWGPQLELGSFPTPYIPTSTGAVTRAETAIYVPASLMPAGGTFSAETRTFAPTGIQGFLLGANGEDFLRLCYNNTSVLLQSNVGGATVLNMGLAKSRSNYVKAAFLYALNNVRLSIDGAAVLVDNSVPLFTLNTLRIAESLNGHIRYLQYYPVALADTQLQLLTSAGTNLIGDKASQLPTAGKLGGMAYLSYPEIAALRQRVELNFLGTGAQVSYTIRRPYPFMLAVVNSIGSTTATLPTAPADGIYLPNENYTLLHNAPVGTIFTVELIPYLV